MKILLVVLILILLLLTAAPTQAHYTAKSTSETIWYGHFNSWCGLGTPWCDVRKIQLFCNKYSDPYDGGHHYRFCVYVYREAKPSIFAAFGIVTRECHMDGEMRHRTILYGARNCTGWS